MSSSSNISKYYKTTSFKDSSQTTLYKSWLSKPFTPVTLCLWCSVKILSSVMSRFDFSHAQRSHFYSAVNISSPRVVVLHDSGQLLCAESNSWQTFDWNHPTLYPLESPLALSGQMPSCFIHVMALLHPLIWRSLRAVAQVSPPFPSYNCQPDPISLFLMFSIWFNSLGNSCSIIRHLPLCICKLQMQLWDLAGWNGQRQLHNRQGCYSKIRLESEVLSVSVNQGAAKWLKPSISKGSEILLHDS